MADPTPMSHLDADRERTRERVVAAVCEELGALPEVIGIVLARPAGGRVDKNSDLDFYVLIDAPWRQRRQFVRESVPVELFLNPPKQADRSIEESEESTIFLLAFGRILMDRTGEAARLAETARRRWDRGPDLLGENAERCARYAVVDTLEDAEDVLERDPSAAMLALHRTVEACLHYLYTSRRRWRPKAKHLLNDLDEWYPEAASRTRAAVLATSAQKAYTAVRSLAQLALEQDDVGFFAWETAPEPV